MYIFSLKKILIYSVILLHILNYQHAFSQSQKSDLTPFKLNGSLSIGYWLNISSTTDATGNKTQQTLPNWYIQGQPTVSIYNMQFPFSANYSNNQLSYTQPFNQYGISPTYKWITLHAGYRNLSLSNYTLSGVTFLGGGIELNPGKFRFAAFYGRFARGIPEDSTLISQNALVIPTYERWGYGFKIGYGSATNHLDLIVTKISDNSNSIELPKNSSIRPGDNLCIALASKFKLSKSINAEFESALSTLTNDLTAGGEFEEVAFLKPVITLNLSSTINPAANASVNYNHKYFGIGMRGEYIGPTFRTFGMYFIQNDLIRGTIKPSLRLFKRKLNLTGSFGYQRDNVVNQKNTTTIRMISSANANLRVGKSLILQGTYSNFGTDQNSGLIQLNDSIRISQVNQSFGGSAILTFPGKSVYSNLIGNYMSQTLDDLNAVTEKFSESQIQAVSVNYAISHKASGVQLGLGLSFNDIVNNQGNIRALGPSARLGWSVPKYKFQVNMSINQQNRTLNNIKDGSVLTLNNDINWSGLGKHRIGIRHQQVINSSSATSLITQNQNRIGITYGYAF